jgi:hypothetical protein
VPTFPFNQPVPDQITLATITLAIIICLCTSPRIKAFLQKKIVRRPPLPKPDKYIDMTYFDKARHTLQ